MCCLKYEQEAYEDLVKSAPKQESFVETPDGAGTVSSVNLLRQTVQVRLESDPESPKCYHNCELCVIRNGKGKRPEGYVQPPLEELAKLRRPTEEETPVIQPQEGSLAAALEAVFQRSAQTSATPAPAPVPVPVPAPVSGEEEETGEEEKPARRRRRRSRRPRGEGAAPTEGGSEVRPAQEEGSGQSRRSRPAQAAPKAPVPQGERSGEGAPSGEKRPRRRRRRSRGGGAKPEAPTAE